MAKTGEHARRDACVHVSRDSIALTADVDKRSLADLETLRDLSVAAVARKTHSFSRVTATLSRATRSKRVFSPPSTVLGHLNGRNEGDFVAYASRCASSLDNFQLRGCRYVINDSNIFLC